MRGYDLPIEQALNEQVLFPAVKAMLSSADFVEGPKAFAEKRTPIWCGR
jgi:crotonobetainyl-CoA hydratase